MLTVTMTTPVNMAAATQLDIGELGEK